jgi:hypothetical protein
MSSTVSSASNLDTLIQEAREKLDAHTHETSSGTSMTQRVARFGSKRNAS